MGEIHKSANFGTSIQARHGNPSSLLTDKPTWRSSHNQSMKLRVEPRHCFAFRSCPQHCNDMPWKYSMLWNVAWGLGRRRKRNIKRTTMGKHFMMNARTPHVKGLLCVVLTTEMRYSKNSKHRDRTLQGTRPRLGNRIISGWIIEQYGWRYELDWTCWTEIQWQAFVNTIMNDRRIPWAAGEFSKKDRTRDLDRVYTKDMQPAIRLRCNTQHNKVNLRTMYLYWQSKTLNRRETIR
jgi:hypothetical protein